MLEELKIEIDNLTEELKNDEEKFNERLNKNPIELKMYNNSMSN